MLWDPFPFQGLSPACFFLVRLGFFPRGSELSPLFIYFFINKQTSRRPLRRAAPTGRAERPRVSPQAVSPQAVSQLQPFVSLLLSALLGIPVGTGSTEGPARLPPAFLPFQPLCFAAFPRHGATPSFPARFCTAARRWEIPSSPCRGCRPLFFPFYPYLSCPFFLSFSRPFFFSFSPHIFRHYSRPFSPHIFQPFPPHFPCHFIYLFLSFPHHILYAFLSPFPPDLPRSFSLVFPLSLSPAPCHPPWPHLGAVMALKRSPPSQSLLIPPVNQSDSLIHHKFPPVNHSFSCL